MILMCTGTIIIQIYNDTYVYWYIIIHMSTEGVLFMQTVHLRSKLYTYTVHIKSSFFKKLNTLEVQSIHTVHFRNTLYTHNCKSYDIGVHFI